MIKNTVLAGLIMLGVSLPAKAQPIEGMTLTRQDVLETLIDLRVSMAIGVMDLAASKNNLTHGELSLVLKTLANAMYVFDDAAQAMGADPLKMEDLGVPTQQEEELVPFEPETESAIAI